MKKKRKVGNTPLLIAARKGNVHIIQTLLEKDPNLDLAENTVFF